MCLHGKTSGLGQKWKDLVRNGVTEEITSASVLIYIVR